MSHVHLLICSSLTTRRYWDWSLDAEPQNNLSMAIYDTVVFSPTEGFGGNGKYVEMDPEVEGIFRDWGRSGGGCVEEGPFTLPNFHVNIGEKNGSSCLRRDFLPAVLHVDADPKEVQEVLDQPNFAAFDRQMEGEPAFDPPAIHAGGHFGIGGLMGQAGDAANSPGGKYYSSQRFWSTLLTATDLLFYMHHTMIDYVYWKWQQKDLEIRNNQVGGPVTPYDYTGTNVTMDFEIDLGDIAPSVPLRDTLDTQGKLFCYTYE